MCGTSRCPTWRSIRSAFGCAASTGRLPSISARASACWSRMLLVLGTKSRSTMRPSSRRGRAARKSISSASATWPASRSRPPFCCSHDSSFSRATSSGRRRVACFGGAARRRCARASKPRIGVRPAAPAVARQWRTMQLCAAVRSARPWRTRAARFRSPLFAIAIAVATRARARLKPPPPAVPIRPRPLLSNPPVWPDGVRIAALETARATHAMRTTPSLAATMTSLAATTTMMTRIGMRASMGRGRRAATKRSCGAATFCSSLPFSTWSFSPCGTLSRRFCSPRTIRRRAPTSRALCLICSWSPRSSCGCFSPSCCCCSL